MKPILLALCAIAVYVTSYGQAPLIQWAKCYGGTSLESGEWIIQTPDSGYIMAGLAQSNNGQVSGNHGGYDVWILKLTPAGAITWQKTYGGTQSEYCNFIQPTRDGGYVFIGTSRSNDGDLSVNYGWHDWWIVKISSTGSIIWKKTYGGSDIDIAHCIKQTRDGGYIAVGCSKSNDGDLTGNHGDLDVWVMKLDSLGNKMWQKNYGGSGAEDAGSVTETNDGNFVIAATTSSADGDVTGNHGGDDFWLLKVSSSGTLIWQKALGGTGDDVTIDDGSSTGFQQTTDSGFIVTGWSDSNNGDVSGNHGSFDYWVVKLDSAANIQWQKSLGGTNDDEATSLQQTSDGGYIVAGIALSNDGDISGSHGGNDFWIAKLSATGAIQWQKCLGGNSSSPGDCPNSILETMGGGYVVAGFTNANDGNVTGNHGSYDYWVVKLSLPLDAGTPPGNTTLALSPNPTNGELFVTGAANTTISICDVKGRLVKQAGNTDHTSVALLPDGIYFIRVFDEQGALLLQEKIIKKQ